MSVILSWDLNGQTVGVEVDATVRENHQGSAQVTEHQVEKGPNITDHIRPLPQKLSLEAFITNTPIKAGVLIPTSTTDGQIRQLNNTPFNTLQFPAKFNRIGDVYDALTTAQKSGALVTVRTTLKKYQNMVITGISAPRDAEMSNAIQFSIEMTEIITVSVVEVQSPAPLVQKKSAGQQVPKQATPTQQAQVNESFIAAFIK